MNLKDKIIVITGASRGLGKELARVFVHAGSKVVLSARSKDELEASAREVGGQSFVADVTDEAQVNNLAQHVVEQFGRIDVWINNAGVWLPKRSVEQLDISRVRAMVEVNLLGTIIGSKVALTQMRQQGTGIILNIISMSALQGRAGSSAYAASKWGAVGFTKSMRLECENSAIQVLSVYPGGMKTDIFGSEPPPGAANFMDPALVAKKISTNMQSDTPNDEFIIDHV